MGVMRTIIVLITDLIEKLYKFYVIALILAAFVTCLSPMQINLYTNDYCNVY